MRIADNSHLDLTKMQKKMHKYQFCIIIFLSTKIERIDIYTRTF